MNHARATQVCHNPEPPKIIRPPATKDIYVSHLPMTRVIRPQAGWYAGDFHCHTHHSDGALSPQELLDTARREGLDFFTITDHNTLAAYAEFGQPDDMLIIPGLEVTFDHGHFNVFGIEHALPWAEPFCPGPTEIKLADTPHTLANLLREAAQAGLLTSINHPLLPPWAWLEGEADLAHVRCVEIWNDPGWMDNRVANPAAVELWSAWLNAGYRITAIGGSDFHRPVARKGPPRMPERLGLPRTMVYAETLSGQAILDGLARRQVYMTMGPRLSFTGTFDGAPVVMGQDLGAVRGTLSLHATVAPGYGGKAILVANGAPVAETHLTGGQAELRYTVALDPATPVWFRLDVHGIDPAQPDELFWAITNPIFTGPTPQPQQTHYKDFVETYGVEHPADRLQWPKIKTPALGPGTGPNHESTGAG